MKIDAPFDNHSPKTFRISTEKLESDISVLEIGYNRVPRGLRQIMKRNVYILHYITSGKGVFLDREFDENNSYIVVPDELEIIEADEETPYEAYWIMFQGAATSNILKKCGLANHNSVFKFYRNKQCAEILRKVIFEITPKNNFEEACIMQSAFYQIMSLHMRDMKENSNSSSLTAQSIMEFIKQNYHQQLKINELAQKNNYTRNYLYILFKKEYNVSPQEYLLTLRIEKAKLLLLDKTKDLSVNEVAFAVGFNDPLYFSRLFHKKTGLSPTKFKKANNS